MNLISIIVPMYNEEENIEKCLNNFISQSNQNFNVIFVDDGSADQTVNKLKNKLSNNLAFKFDVLKQKNKGAAAARELGIDHAITEFVMIHDCDDKISTDFIEEIYKIIEKYNDVDIILPDLKIQSKDGKYNDFSFYTNDIFLKPSDCVINSIDGWKVHGCFVCRKNIFLKSYNEYYYYNNHKINFINNDEIITRLNFKNSKKIIRTNVKYFYCYNEQSTTKKINQDRYFIMNNAVILCRIFSDNFEIKPYSIAELISVIWGVFIYMHQNKSNINNLELWRQNLKKNINDIKYFDLVVGLELKKKLQLTILKLSNLF